MNYRDLLALSGALTLTLCPIGLVSASGPGVGTIPAVGQRAEQDVRGALKQIGKVLHQASNDQRSWKLKSASLRAERSFAQNVFDRCKSEFPMDWEASCLLQEAELNAANDSFRASILPLVEEFDVSVAPLQRKVRGAINQIVHRPSTYMHLLRSAQGRDPANSPLNYLFAAEAQMGVARAAASRALLTAHLGDLLTVIKGFDAVISELEDMTPELDGILDEYSGPPAMTDSLQPHAYPEL